MKVKQFIKNNICFAMLCIVSVSVFAQKPPKPSKTFSVQVYQNDSLFDISVLHKGKHANEFTNAERLYYWFSSGAIQKNQGSYVQNPLHGNCVIKNNRKQVIAQGLFNEGVKHGIWKHWDSKGNILYTQEWKNGLREGKTTYYLQGNVVKIEQYENNKLHGKTTSFAQLPLEIHTKYRKGIAIKTDTTGIPKQKKIKAEKKSKDSEPKACTKKTKKVKSSCKKNSAQANSSETSTQVTKKKTCKLARIFKNCCYKKQSTDKPNKKQKPHAD